MVAQGSTTDKGAATAAGYAGDLSPQQAWELLQQDKDAVLVDVRTPAEWEYVGFPDLSALDREPLFLPWQLYPAMTVNPEFVAALKGAGLSGARPVLFLCRSGVRSKAAAIAMTGAGMTRCYNIADGFEGPLDAARHRGTASGWKAAGLPWVQK